MAAKSNIKFEEALGSLEDKVRSLESSELTLDEALKVYEEAVKLIKICNERLEKAEQRVKILTEGLDGTVTDAPFGALEDEA